MRGLSPRDPAIVPHFPGLVSSLGISYRLLRARTIRVTFSRDLQYSYEVLQPYFLDNSLAVSVRRALGQDFDVIVDGQRHLYRYTNFSAAVPGAELLDARSDRTLVYAASLGYRVNHDTRIGFGATF